MQGNCEETAVKENRQICLRTEVYNFEAEEDKNEGGANDESAWKEGLQSENEHELPLF